MFCHGRSAEDGLDDICSEEKGLVGFHALVRILLSKEQGPVVWTLDRNACRSGSLACRPQLLVERPLSSVPPGEVASTLLEPRPRACRTLARPFLRIFHERPGPSASGLWLSVLAIRRWRWTARSSRWRPLKDSLRLWDRSLCSDFQKLSTLLCLSSSGRGQSQQEL